MKNCRKFQYCRSAQKTSLNLKFCVIEIAHRATYIQWLCLDQTESEDQIGRTFPAWPESGLIYFYNFLQGGRWRHEITALGYSFWSFRQIGRFAGFSQYGIKYHKSKRNGGKLAFFTIFNWRDLVICTAHGLFILIAQKKCWLNCNLIFLDGDNFLQSFCKRFI